VNKTFVNSNSVIEVVCKGSQTEASLNDAKVKGLLLAKKLRREGRPVNILVDISRLGKIDVAARRQAARIIQNVDYDKIAVFGSSPLAGNVGRLVIRGIGQTEKIRIFSSRSLAEKWLSQELTESSSPEDNSHKKLREEDYHAYVEAKVSQLLDIISRGVIGDYSKDVVLPEEDDEFLEVFVGIGVLIDTLEAKAERLRRLSKKVVQK
jgi:N-acetylglutamate synthase/N-acetylornithine aminotransferase